MTNEQIIFNARFSLMEAGKIGNTGRKIEVETEEGTETMMEPEEIHTYTAWKERGFQVIKGQHAVAKITIWKHTTKHNDEKDRDEEKMFHKVAAFFSQAQVQAI